MKRNKRDRSQFLISGLLIMLALFALPVALFSPLGGDSAAAQTVPTRTPPPSGGGSGGGSGGSEPTPTPPAASPTATPLPVTIAPTPIDGFVTPERCGIPLFQASRGEVNVRDLPSAEGDLVSVLVFLEVREITGRAETAEWWRIKLADGRLGWAADDAGTVFGNIGGLPVLDDSGAPVASGSWNPTPDPVCPTVTPTSTPLPETPTAEPSASATPSQTPTPEAEPDSAATTAAAAEATAEAIPTSTATPSPSPTVEPTAEPTPLPTPEPAPAGGGTNWLLIAGIVLVLAGLSAYVWQRLRGS